MIIHGADLLAGLIDECYPDIKAIFNNVGILLFPSSNQHREQKAIGLSYEDDSRGNALAAIIRLNAIEVRRH